MRIALVHTRFARRGGIEGYLHSLVGHLLDRGEEVHFFASRWEPYERQGITFHKVRRWGLTGALKVITFDRNVRRAIRRSEFDVVHGFTKTSRQDVYTDGSGCLEDFEKVSLPLRNPVARFLRRRGWHRRAVARMEALRYQRGNFRKVIAMSRMARDQVCRRYGLTGTEVEVLYHGVDTDAFSPGVRRRRRAEQRRTLGVGDDLVVLFVGNDDSRKGADILLEGLHALGESRRGVRALIAGRPRSARALTALAGSLGVKVDILGFRDDIPGLLAAADLFVLPSRFDIFGMSALEAMAAGVPPLVSRTAGVSEILTHGEDGWLMETEDPQGLARGIRELADPARRESMGLRARETAKRYSMDRHLDRLLEIYREVAEEKKASRREPERILG